MASGKFHALKINLAIGFTRKNRLEYIGKAVMMLHVPWLTKRQVEYFDLQPTLHENFEIHLYFVCQPDGRPASLP